MNITFLKGYPDYIGKRFAWAGFGTGPASYNPAVGDPVLFPRYDNYVDAIPSCMSVSGNYELKFVPSAAGARATWNAYWYYSGREGVTSVVQNVAGSGMTAGTYALSASGGGGTGFAGTVTVLTATTIATPVITNPGSGYTSAPTITATTGGTAPTFTVTVAAASGAVANTTNLSTETAQVSGLGGTY